MQSVIRSRGAKLAGLLVLALAALTPTLAEAKPEAGAKRGFRLFARPLGAMTINQIYCGLASTGQICVDSTNSSTIGGGFWPKGTANQYVFQMGVQIAGIVGSDGGPWAGDTTGAFFVDTKGTTEHGREVRPIYNSSNPDDAANWPLAARVQGPQPNGDDIFNPLLVDRIAASQGDIWFVTWDGDPALNAGRNHPLGVMAETRGMGWNFPKGNEDIIYFVVNFFNVTSAVAADYANVKPGMQEIAIEQGQQFQALNNAAFGITLPTGGYTITEAYPAYITDMDVADAGVNYASVNLPFALGDTYDHSFSRFEGWTFDPAIFSAPFFAGTGFVGVKYLKSPTGPGAIQLYSNTINGGAFGDAANTTQLWRYLSGNISVAAGDAPCNTGNPAQTHICYINNTAPNDMRFFQSSTPLEIGPGEYVSVVTAGIFAAPVADASCAPPCDILPGDPRIMGDAAAMAIAVPDQQKLAGYIGFNDINTDGIVTQDEFVVVSGSLLGKALTAQAVFDNGFLLPFAPEAPEFFLIPGDDQVTVMWQQTVSETAGDPFFEIANQAQIGGSVNALYDPNYRQFDVEGYRIYRGRVDAPNELTLLAQYDYDGTTMNDFGGQVNPSPLCAPELSLVAGCSVAYNPAEFVPGVTRTVSEAKDLVGALEQVKLGERTLLADGTAFTLISDTAVVGGANTCAPSSCPPLGNTGVPFVFVDNTVRNDFRYFYAVTAFDINSYQSGPSNLESPRITKPVVPRAPASNYENTADLVKGIYGRDVLLDHTAPSPTLDPVDGRFSGPMPASNAWDIGLASFVEAVISQPGALQVILDSLQLGAPYSGIAHNYWFTAVSGSTSQQVMIPILQPAEIGLRTGSANLPSVFIDGSLAARYGGNGNYSIPGAMEIEMEGPDYHSLYGRGCVNSRAGFTDNGSRNCAYNGSRWFDGPSPTTNETKVDPIEGNQANFSGTPMTNFNNAGELSGVSLIHNTQAYQSVGGGEFRPMEGIKSGARRAADFNVYWGAGGLIDSVIDVTHNVPVPFASDHLGGTWGILNPSESATNPGGSYDGRPEFTSTDFHCVPPVNNYDTGSADCAGAVFTLSQTAVPGPIVPYSPSLSAAQSAPVWSDPGFGLYLSGDIFTIGLAGGTLPAAGTVWALRTYIGAINGGNGDAGNLGPYVYNEIAPRSWTAVGTDIRVSWDVVNQVNKATVENLDQVHPVPDPYYVTNEFETGPDNSIIKFVNLPQKAIIRIYSASGVLVTLLEHNSDQFGGSLDWNVRNRNNQVVASGVYFYHIESGDARRVGRMTIVRFAQ